MTREDRCRQSLGGVRLRSAILATSMLCVAGCGVAQYEDKMAYANERIRYMEEVNKSLGAPFSWPEFIPPKPGQPPAQIVSSSEVFFRPPAGIASEGKLPPYGPTLFSFGRETAAGPSPFQEMFFGVTNSKSSTVFKQEALTRLGAPTDLKWTPRSVDRGPGRPAYQFDSTTYDDRNKVRHLVFVFAQEPPYTVMIVYKVAAADAAAPTTQKVIDNSLSSLALGSAAIRPHQAYQARPRT